MASRIVTVGSSSGLHARPAKIISEAAAAAGIPVHIGRIGADPIDAASILLLMSQGIGAGEEVEVTSDDDAVLDQIATLVATDLDAEES